ncbi:MAG: tyrosine-protein phosphatase [Lautropia sp.]
MIDLHCHYLPDVDDGARDLQEAIALIKLAVKDGATDIVLTPHVYAGRWDNTLATLQPRFDAFSRLIASKQLPVTLYLGAEVHLQPETIDLVERRQVPFVGHWNGDPAILLELHDGRIPPFALAAVRHLRSLGVVPIIAHPERNKAVMSAVDCIEPFVAAGCLLQLTAASVAGRFGAVAERTAFRLIDRGWAHFIGSDAHNLLHRPPMLRAARRVLRERYGQDVATAMTRSVPEQLIEPRRTGGAGLVLDDRAVAIGS